MTRWTVAALVVAAIVLGGCADWVGDELSSGDAQVVERPDDVADVSTSTTAVPPDPVDPRALAVGACADDVAAEDGSLPDSIEIVAEGATVTPRTCDEEHRYEVYAVTDLGGGDAGWAGQEQVDEDALRLCTARLEEYVGVRWSESSLDLVVLAPDEGRWNGGDRAVHCVLFDLGLEQLEGSSEGTGR